MFLLKVQSSQYFLEYNDVTWSILFVPHVRNAGGVYAMQEGENLSTEI